MVRMPLPTDAFAIALVAACCLPASLAAADESLTGDWKLVKIGEREVPKSVTATLSVAADGKFSGNTGVNRYSGKLATEKKLFEKITSTLRAGPPEAMEVENGLTQGLSEATRFAVKDKSLTLFVGDKPRLVFEKVEKPN
jgi:putative lipoprotein